MQPTGILICFTQLNLDKIVCICFIPENNMELQKKT